MKSHVAVVRRCTRSKSWQSVITPDPIWFLQVYKVGKKVAARVIGARPMDGLAVCSLKEAAVRAGTISYSDIAPGAVVSGTVENIEDFGLFVKLAPGIKCAALLSHTLLHLLLIFHQYW